jgi:ketosteroid isomerase-like protein
VFALLISIAAATTVCAERPEPRATSGAANKALARELFDAISRADVAKLDELYADDFEIWTAGSLPISGTRTRAQALEGMSLINSMFPDGIAFTIHAMTAEGDRVAIEASSEGVHVSGLRYRNEYHFLMVVRDGKIVRFKEYMDTLHAKEVLLAPPRDAGRKPSTSP